ncbi:DsbA family oxidoreductase [Actinomadura macrotermitis]|uniref:DSBA-like thioredoxin domain-containing protein n=1 Tax=Actinomadura macrotermitis TaxID=2585200 RepID=A0A7K0C665_9ACTN|nr:DsbA family protein [Actinomadura macrotermitis]MQY08925.1 hypothetical protein [Actinomadura macrotermitis]
MKVEIIHDIACAWSALGYARLHRAAAEHRAGGGELTVVFRPYRSAVTSAGSPPGRVHSRLASSMRAERIAREAAADGLVMNLDRIVPADTTGAHRLIALAAAHGTAEEMAARLYRAYFTDGLDVADAGVLRDLASAFGMPWNGEPLPADLVQPAPASGPPVPVFRFPDGIVLVGAVTLATLQAELGRAVYATA